MTVAEITRLVTKHHGSAGAHHFCRPRAHVVNNIATAGEPADVMLVIIIATESAPSPF